MKTITPAMAAHLRQTVTTLANCWRIKREDGVVLGFTDHDVKLTIGETVYEATTGFFRSAIANSADVAADNMDVAGFLDDDSIKEDELRNGAFDYAEIEVFAVNWMDLSQDIIRLRTGRFGEVTLTSSGFFKVELRGLTALFSQVIGEVYAPECRADLGDHRCKVELIPKVHVTGRAYSEGERILVPGDEGVNVQLPLVNPSFEIFEAPESAWGPDLAVLNVSPTGQPESYFYLRPRTASGSYELQISRSEFSTNRPSLRLAIKANTDTHEYRIRCAVAMDARRNDLHVKLSGWTSVPAGETLVLELPTTAIPEAYFRFYPRIEWRPKAGMAGAPNVQLTPSILDNGTVHAGYAIKEPTLNVSNVSGWIIPSGQGGTQLSVKNVFMAPHSGSRFLTLIPQPGFNRTISQRVRFDNLPGIDLERVDAGEFNIQLNHLWGGETHSAQGTLELEFFNTVGAASGTKFTQKPVVFTAIRSWHENTFKVDVPPGAREVRVRFTAAVVDQHVKSRLAVDSIEMRMFDDAYVQTSNYTRFNRVEYVCTTAGITAPEKPEYSTLVGDTVVDGSAAFLVVFAKHMFVGEVVSVTDHSTFTIDGVDQPDGWFEWGVIEMLTGKNRSKRIEVQSWSNETKQLKLYLPFPYRPIPRTVESIDGVEVVTPGDLITIHTGCSKTRNVCQAKFENILNYRGEPDLPGTDAYFKVAGSGHIEGGGTKGSK